MAYADNFFKFSHCPNVSDSVSDVVASGEYMGGIDADADSFLTVDGLEHFGNVFEAMAETGTLTSGCFQKQTSFGVRHFMEHLVNTIGEASDSL